MTTLTKFVYYVFLFKKNVFESFTFFAERHAAHGRPNADQQPATIRTL